MLPGYCFARFQLAEKLAVLTTPGLVEIVGANGAIEPVPGAEIEAVRALVNGPLRYDPCPFLAEGMEVEVVRGPLMGVRGRLIRKDRTARLVIAITLIRFVRPLWFLFHLAEVDAPRSWIKASGRLGIGGGKGSSHLLLLLGVRGIVERVGIDLLCLGLSLTAPEGSNGLIHQSFDQRVSTGCHATSDERVNSLDGRLVETEGYAFGRNTHGRSARRQ